jgi:hypothetical protein
VLELIASVPASRPHSMPKSLSMITVRLGKVLTVKIGTSYWRLRRAGTICRRLIVKRFLRGIASTALCRNWWRRCRMIVNSLRWWQLCTVKVGKLPTRIINRGSLSPVQVSIGQWAGTQSQSWTRFCKTLKKLRSSFLNRRR